MHEVAPLLSGDTIIYNIYIYIYIHIYIHIYIYIYIYINSLIIYEENTKEHHNCVRSLYVIKTHVPLYVKKFVFLAYKR